MFREYFSGECNSHDECKKFIVDETDSKLYCANDNMCYSCVNDDCQSDYDPINNSNCPCNKKKCYIGFENLGKITGHVDKIRCQNICNNNKYNRDYGRTVLCEWGEGLDKLTLTKTVKSITDTSNRNQKSSAKKKLGADCSAQDCGEGLWCTNEGKCWSCKDHTCGNQYDPYEGTKCPINCKKGYKKKGKDNSCTNHNECKFPEKLVLDNPAYCNENNECEYCTKPTDCEYLQCHNTSPLGSCPCNKLGKSKSYFKCEKDKKIFRGAFIEGKGGYCEILSSQSEKIDIKVVDYYNNFTKNKCKSECNNFFSKEYNEGRILNGCWYNGENIIPSSSSSSSGSSDSSNNCEITVNNELSFNHSDLEKVAKKVIKNKTDCLELCTEAIQKAGKVKKCVYNLENITPSSGSSDSSSSSGSSCSSGSSDSSRFFTNNPSKGIVLSSQRATKKDIQEYKGVVSYSEDDNYGSWR